MLGPTGANKKGEREKEREKASVQIDAKEPQARPRRTRTSGSLEDLSLCLRLFLLLVGPLGGDFQPS